jgi:hypothetical protein
MDPAPTVEVIRLIGVYDADGTPLGELRYWIGARLGRTHCALCDITHGSVRARPEWGACRRRLAVPFDTYHRDDQPDAVRRAAAGRAPVVAAETAAAVMVLLGPAELDGLDGTVDGLMAAVEARLAAEGLRLRSGH